MTVGGWVGRRQHDTETESKWGMRMVRCAGASSGATLYRSHCNVGSDPKSNAVEWKDLRRGTTPGLLCTVKGTPAVAQERGGCGLGAGGDGDWDQW